MRALTRPALAAALLSIGCHAQTMAPGRRQPPRAPAPARSAEPRIVAPGAALMPDSVHWVRNSAEYRAAVLQAFRLATDRLERAYHGRAPGTWGVIADADETLIDNSQYQKERAAVGGGFTPESWAEWVNRRAAPAQPGAVEFARRARDLGARLIVVTNRAESACASTEANLRAIGFVFDAVLCRPEGAGASKQERFDAVAQGRTAKNLPAVEVVLWIGHNILDFPGVTQEARSNLAGLADFGSRFVVIPNPMYGSWERTPRN